MIAHSGKYEYSPNDYINTKIKTTIFCKKCKKEFKQTPTHHTKGHGCPYCNESKGEKVIFNFLIENCIKFEQQKKFDNCKNRRKLSFDFYLPTLNMCIEFDGKQHFEPYYKGGDEKTFEVQIENDNIKNSYCYYNNINLLRIKYDENIIEKIKNNINI